MAKVTVKCDRCGATVEGLRAEGVTGGFYDVAPPSTWAQYANEGEAIVCDECMFADPRYQAVYGDHSAKGQAVEDDEPVCAMCGGSGTVMMTGGYFGPPEGVPARCPECGDDPAE